MPKRQIRRPARFESPNGPAVLQVVPGRGRGRGGARGQGRRPSRRLRAALATACTGTRPAALSDNPVPVSSFSDAAAGDASTAGRPDTLAEARSDTGGLGHDVGLQQLPTHGGPLPIPSVVGESGSLPQPVLFRTSMAGGNVMPPVNSTASAGTVNIPSSFSSSSASVGHVGVLGPWPCNVSGGVGQSHNINNNGSVFCQAAPAAQVTAQSADPSTVLSPVGQFGRNLGMSVPFSTSSSSFSGPSPLPPGYGCSTLDAHVPLALKEKIWSGKFIDFAALHRDNAVFALTHADSGSVLTLAVDGDKVVFRPASAQKKKIDSIEKWMSAFHSFMAVYTVRHPGRCAELLKYAETVRMASVQFPGLGWRSYDEQFRLRQEANPARSWAELDVELWVTVAAASVIAPASVRQDMNVGGFSGRASNHGNNYTSISNTSGYKSHVCFAYNTEKGCRWQFCKFAHRCKRCALHGHGLTNCRVNTNFRAKSEQSAMSAVRNFSPPSSRRVQPQGGSTAMQPVSRVAKGGDQGGAVRAQQAHGSFRGPHAN